MNLKTNELFSEIDLDLDENESVLSAEAADTDDADFCSEVTDRFLSDFHQFGNADETEWRGCVRTWASSQLQSDALADIYDVIIKFDAWT